MSPPGRGDDAADRGPAAGRGPAAWRAVRRGWRRLEAGHDAVFLGRWRRDLARQARREDEQLVSLLLLEALGAQSPVSYYALEVYPWLATRTHELHRARGIDRLDSGACC